jgi:hypothetical protein
MMCKPNFHKKKRKIDDSEAVNVDGIPSMLMPNPLQTQDVLARVKQLKSISFMAPLMITRTGKEKKPRFACKSR